MLDRRNFLKLMGGGCASLLIGSNAKQVFAMMKPKPLAHGGPFKPVPMVHKLSLAELAGHTHQITFAPVPNIIAYMEGVNIEAQHRHELTPRDTYTFTMQVSLTNH